MRFCIVGIGGCGGKVTEQFLQNQDISSEILSRLTGAEYISPGGIQGIWIESDKNDAENINKFFGDLRKGSYPGYFIPHDSVPDGSKVHIAIKEKYGYDVKKMGYFRDAQYLKAVFEIFESDADIQRIASQELKSPSPIFESAWESISKYTTLTNGKCDGILFIVSLGGGTGTGFINPIVKHIRTTGKGDYPVFVLAILTEEGDFSDKEQFANEARRDLGAISSIYDLVTKRNGVDGLIIVDNQILINKFDANYDAINKFLYKAMQPLIMWRDFHKEKLPSLSARELFIGELLYPNPPIFIPYYWSQPKGESSGNKIIAKAISEGMLCGCDYQQADKAFIFSRGFLSADEMRKTLSSFSGIREAKIGVWRKLGDGKNDEVLILFRNPYGKAGAYKQDNTLEKRLHRVIEMAIQYIDTNRSDLLKEREVGEPNDLEKEEECEGLKLNKETRDALENYFYGDNGLKNELQTALSRLEDGKKPFFKNEHELRIFDKISSESSGREEMPDLREFAEIDEKHKAFIAQLVLAEFEKLKNGEGSKASKPPSPTVAKLRDIQNIK